MKILNSKNIFSLITLLAVNLTTSVPVSAQTTDTWADCANEDAKCSFQGTKDVRFGADTRWVTKTLTDGTLCSNSVFGDPAFGVLKKCQIKVVPEVTWTNCSAENGTCSFTGTREVRYGAGTKWVSKTFTDRTPCTNDVFGDPAYGVLKSCQYSSVIISPPAAAWTNCAAENATCSFSGTREVRYGAGNNWVVKVFTETTPCTNAVFGDPASGVVKTCQYGAQVSSTPTPPTNPPSLPIEAGAITNIQIENLSGVNQTSSPFTFGQAFIKGQVSPTDGLSGKLSDGSMIPLQVNVKALHTDGSVRHAIVSGILPALAGSANQVMSLVKSTGPGTLPDITPDDLIQEGVNSDVNLNVNGVLYRVSLEELLRSGKYKTWLKGPIATEFILSSSIKAVSNGALHPHLAARFAVRSYRGLKKAKIDVIVENGWLYEPNPRDVTYDVEVDVNGRAVFTQTGLNHYHHARWKKSFWIGSEPQLHLKHNTAYLIESKALPNYDQSLKFSEMTLGGLQYDWEHSPNGPMGNGIAAGYMPTTGGRPEIGLNPSWAVKAVLSNDKRAKKITFAMGDLAGSWSTHYRDKATDEPMSLADHPYMTLIAGTYADYNPDTKQSEYIPNCSGACNSPNFADVSHQPNVSYIPYLLSGEHYYMEELMFYGMWNIGTGNPAYRSYGKGLFQSEQVRGQAWGLRVFFDAAYILPDSVRHKSHFKTMIAENMKWYNDTYTNNPQANVFGVITNGYALAYNNGTGMAPWQDDFFTSAIGRGAEYEFPGALELLKWKAKFTAGRMTDPGYCWILASAYSFNIKSSSSSPNFTTYREAYLATIDPSVTSKTCNTQEFANALQAVDGSARAVVNVMTGYPEGTAGYPANFQPAAAFAKDSGITNASKAWDIFNARGMKPDYSTDPQFDILPRSK